MPHAMWWQCHCEFDDSHMLTVRWFWLLRLVLQACQAADVQLVCLSVSPQNVDGFGGLTQDYQNDQKICDVRVGQTQLQHARQAYQDIWHFVTSSCLDQSGCSSPVARSTLFANMLRWPRSFTGRQQKRVYSFSSSEKVIYNSNILSMYRNLLFWAGYIPFMFFFSLHKNQFKLHMYFTCGLQRWTIRLFFCSVMCVSAQTGVLSDFVKVLKIRGLDVIDFLKAAGLPHLPLLFGSKHSCDYALAPIMAAEWKPSDWVRLDGSLGCSHQGR